MTTHRRATRPRRPAPSEIAARWRRIAAAAYLRAQRRGFASGAALEDWLEAEKAVDAELIEEAETGPRTHAGQ